MRSSAVISPDNDKHRKRGKNFVYTAKHHANMRTSENLALTSYSHNNDLFFLEGILSRVSYCEDGVFRYTNKNIDMPDEMQMKIYNKIEGVISSHQYSDEELNQIKNLQAFRIFLQNVKKQNSKFNSSKSAPEEWYRATSTAKMSTEMARQQLHANQAKRKWCAEQAKAEQIQHLKLGKSLSAEQPLIKKQRTNLSQSAPADCRETTKDTSLIQLSVFSSQTQASHQDILALERNKVRQKCEEELVGMIVENYHNANKQI